MWAACMSNKRTAILILAWLACGGAGCIRTPSPPPAEPAMPMLLTPREPPRRVLVVQMQLVSIEVPVGSATSSEDIWSYVDEEPASASRASALGINGFRVGLARQESWPSLEKIFRQLTGRQGQAALLSSLPGDPVQVVLKPGQPAQTLFLFHADRTPPTGEDYPPCDNLLTVMCSLDEDEPNRLIVLGQPQMWSTERSLQYVEEGGRYLYAARPRVYGFPELTFRLRVALGEIIVVGPGSSARRGTSVARHFLIKQRNGIEFETVLVLIPRVVPAMVWPATAPTVPPGVAAPGSP